MRSLQRSGTDFSRNPPAPGKFHSGFVNKLFYAFENRFSRLIVVAAYFGCFPAKIERRDLAQTFLIEVGASK
jgi:hypothetical protein